MSTDIEFIRKFLDTFAQQIDGDPITTLPLPVNPADRGKVGPNTGTEWQPKPKPYTGYGARTLTQTYTPQSQPISGKESVMVPNNAGGYTFAIHPLEQFERFLILGTAGGTYYAGEIALTRDNLMALEALVRTGFGLLALEKIVAISDQGRAVSNDPALFALAYLCAAPDNTNLRRKAYAALPKVARTGTHFFHFNMYVKQFRGRGALHRKAMKAWYTERPLKDLVFQAVKYQQRDGWSQRDLLRLTRPKAPNSDYQTLYKWIVKGVLDAPFYNREIDRDDPLTLIYAIEAAKQIAAKLLPSEVRYNTPDVENMAKLIRLTNLPREGVPTQMLQYKIVWEALLLKMPLEATLRNLATMTRNGTLTDGGQWAYNVCQRLTDQDYIKASRLHPMKILVALRTYQSGKSVRGDSTWTPLPEIVQALNTAFRLAFGNVTVTNKRMLLALDVSGSMSWNTSVIGYSQKNPQGTMGGMTARDAAAAMAMITYVTEPNCTVMAFSHKLEPVAITKEMTLGEVMAMIDRIPMGGTDCALPMVYARENRVQVDTFVIYTDNETHADTKHGHPTEALKCYIQYMGISAKLAVVAMTSVGFSIADSTDPGTLDVVGFDASTPEALAQFALL